MKNIAIDPRLHPQDVCHLDRRIQAVLARNERGAGGGVRLGNYRAVFSLPSVEIPMGGKRGARGEARGAGSEGRGGRRGARSGAMTAAAAAIVRQVEAGERTASSDRPTRTTISGTASMSASVVWKFTIHARRA